MREAASPFLMRFYGELDVQQTSMASTPTSHMLLDFADALEVNVFKLGSVYLKLIKKLPESVIEKEVPLLLGTVCTTLKSRDQDVRDGARGALAKIATELSERYGLQVFGGHQAGSSA